MQGQFSPFVRVILKKHDFLVMNSGSTRDVTEADVSTSESVFIEAVACLRYSREPIRTEDESACRAIVSGNSPLLTTAHSLKFAIFPPSSVSIRNPSDTLSTQLTLTSC